MPPNVAAKTPEIPRIGTLTAEIPLPNSKLSWVSKFLARALPSSWERVVVNESVDSITMPKWVAVAILGAILTFGMGAWWRASTEHDTLIEIRTELRLAKEAQAEKDRITNGKLSDLAAWEGVVNGKLSEIKGMLSQQQIDALNRGNIQSR